MRRRKWTSSVKGGKVSPVDPTSQPVEPFDFEKSVEQIERIIERIESGQVGLEKSIAEYERGAALLKRCREALAAAEQRVEDLTARMQSDASQGGPTAEKKGPPRRGEPESPF